MAEVSTGDLAVLVLAPFGKDAALIERVLLQSAIPTRAVTSVQDLGAAISEDAGAAIIPEEVLQNGTIGALAQKLSTQPPWSDFPILVLTGSGMSTAKHGISGALSGSSRQRHVARTAIAARYAHQCRT